MLSFRTFRNSDPPLLTEIWRNCAGRRGLARHVSSDLLEQLVFAKPYFDRRGLFVATDDTRPVGFAHAGFGPNAAQDGISTEKGLTCLVLVLPDCDEAQVADGLLSRCEAYLQQRGAKELYGGGIRPLVPFYMGLYGGSEMPGILRSDEVAQALFTSHGYDEIARTLILHRDLADFQASIDRQQMQLRRRMIVEVTVDPPSQNWWEACTIGEFDLTRFDVIPRGRTTPVARAVFRSMEPAGTATIGRAAGLIELEVAEPMRRRGMALFLLTEAFRQFIRQGIMLVEVQGTQSNLAAVRTFQKLAFREVGQGSVFRKR